MVPMSGKLGGNDCRDADMTTALSYHIATLNWEMKIRVARSMTVGPATLVSWGGNIDTIACLCKTLAKIP